MQTLTVQLQKVREKVTLLSVDPTITTEEEVCTNRYSSAHINQKGGLMILGFTYDLIRLVS